MLVIRYFLVVAFFLTICDGSPVRDLMLLAEHHPGSTADFSKTMKNLVVNQLLVASIKQRMLEGQLSNLQDPQDRHYMDLRKVI